MTSIPPVSALGPDDLVEPLVPSALAPRGQTAFADLVAKGVQALDADLVQLNSELQQVAAGTGGELHQVMVRMEEVRLSFQLFLQVRNKVLDAYQDLMKMQV